MSLKAIARARKYLQTGQRDIDHGDYESSVSRAYYAMFYMTRALLQQEQIEARTHSGIINQFSLHFVKTKQLPLALARTLQETFNLRQLAEYAEDFIIPRLEAETTLQEAKDFVDHLERLLT